MLCFCYLFYFIFFFFFFFQAEDGIRDRNVTGVQTYALPIYEIGITTVARGARGKREGRRRHEQSVAPDPFAQCLIVAELERLGERRLQHLPEARQGRLDHAPSMLGSIEKKGALRYCGGGREKRLQL